MEKKYTMKEFEKMFDDAMVKALDDLGKEIKNETEGDTFMQMMVPMLASANMLRVRKELFENKKDSK